MRIVKGRKDRKSTGTKTETTPCFSSSAQLLFLDSPDHLPRGGTSQSGLGPLIPIGNQENVPQTCPPIEANPQLRLLLPKCVKLTTDAHCDTWLITKVAINNPLKQYIS